MSPAPRPWPSPFPRASSFAGLADEIVYRFAYQDCILVPLEQLADDYSGDPTDPQSVARGYATAIAPDRQVPAEQGCLDGIAAHRAHDG